MKNKILPTIITTGIVTSIILGLAVFFGEDVTTFWFIATTSLCTLLSRISVEKL